MWDSGGLFFFGEGGDMVGPVCERNTGGTDVTRVGMCTVGVRQFDGSPSTRRWVVEVYVPPGPHQGAPVGFGYTYKTVNLIYNIYQFIHISIIV